MTRFASQRHSQKKKKHSSGGVYGDNVTFTSTYIDDLPSEGEWGTRWHSWLRHCATSRNVAGSIPDGVIGILH